MSQEFKNQRDEDWIDMLINDPFNRTELEKTWTI